MGGTSCLQVLRESEEEQTSERVLAGPGQSTLCSPQDITMLSALQTLGGTHLS